MPQRISLPRCRGKSRSTFSKTRITLQKQMYHIPIPAFTKLSDLELKAVYRYLQTVEPVHNEIKNIVAKKEGI